MRREEGFDRRHLGGLEFLGSFVLPLLLLAASEFDWNLISFINLIAFFVVQFTKHRRGLHIWWRSWFLIIFSLSTIVAQVVFNIFWFIEGNEWTKTHAWWAKLIGLVRVQPWGPMPIVYFLVLQLAIVFVAYIETQSTSIRYQCSSWRKFTSAASHLGSHLKVACCLLLPAIQLVVGISHSSWIFLPFFICSCVSLVDWSLTSNFLGLFRWWRSLLLYACFSIIMLYLYQLPVELPKIPVTIAEFIGLYKISSSSEWPEIVSSLSLLLFFFMLSSVRHDLEDMDYIMSTQRSGLTEHLIPYNHSFFIRESRSGVKHTNVLLRGSVYRHFSINFFTYGFPVLLLALSLWSFSFASICAFGLLAFVGYILYAFPSLFHLHRLNGLLLIFILLWAASTYIFNVAFTLLNKSKEDMEIWETIGLWHYPIPGLYLFAQFCLGVLVAIGNLVNDSVFLHLSNEDGMPRDDENDDEDKEDKKVFAVATIAWAMHKCSRVITLALIFVLAMKPGFIHAVYMICFLVYLLSHSVSRTIRQALVLLCEAHFVVLYILQLGLISKILKNGGSLTREILLQLGLRDHANILDFTEIGALLCFCALQNHGFKMILSFSNIVQRTPSPPFGFSILKAGLNKSVLLCVYASPHVKDDQSDPSPHEQRIAAYLKKVEQKYLCLYRSCGTYVALLTILLVVYQVTPNYISFGYLFFLLFWITGRQLAGKTKRRLWFPLRIYAVLIFVFKYSLSNFSRFEAWVSAVVSLNPDLGFNPEASLLGNVWESLVVLIVMELYSYERRKSGHDLKTDDYSSKSGFCGFARRFLVRNSEKIQSVAVFYASLSPISLFGFIYLLGLVGQSILPKMSRLPSKLFLVFTGLVFMSEYVFQLWGKSAHMFPGQDLSNLSVFLGFRSFSPGFWGLESGLRGRVLVIVACTLQYNVFYWADNMPAYLRNRGKWEEPCHLFVSPERTYTEADEENTSLLDSSDLNLRRKNLSSKSWPSFHLDVGQASDSEPAEVDNTKKKPKRFTFGYIWGTSKESNKWNKKRIYALKKERFAMQKSALKAYMKFYMENMFVLFSLEINMVVLLLASFALLNAFSMIYIVSLLSFILLNRQILRKVWFVFVILFASILILEYFAMWQDLPSWVSSPEDASIHCHECWRSSHLFFNQCQKCWLGLTVDDPRMLVSYYVVFIFSSFKLRSDHLVSLSGSYTYSQMRSQLKSASLWRELSFETKSMWTILDYLRLYCYCHLVDIVLILILITGTLEYDILHLGYLGFALVFFRMRLEILKKKNEIFKYLRMYNLVVIVLSLAYQSPYIGGYNSGKCEKIDYIYEFIGFYKYDYGFRITSRSALVEIVIFMLVAMQSYIFCSKEFDYVSRYLETEQIGAIVREQEKKAAWKTAQLQHIRKSEEQMQQRNLQVEKIKAEMLNLQIRLHSMDSLSNGGNTPPKSEGLRRRRNSPRSDEVAKKQDEEQPSRKEEEIITPFPQFPSDYFASDIQINDSFSQASPELQDSPVSRKSESSFSIEALRHSMNSICEITELGEKDHICFQGAKEQEIYKAKHKENRLRSAVQLIGDGVSQVQYLGNRAVTNIVSFLKIDPNESGSDGYLSAEDGLYDEVESQPKPSTGGASQLNREFSAHSGSVVVEPVTASLQIGRIFRFVWAQMRSNNDIVCYICFVLVFLWNFSLMSMVYIAALFLYALCVNSGPSYLFWVIMLVYTEVNISLQYLYQIIIQHCGFTIRPSMFQRLGFPTHKITTSFVISTLPLFMVYVSTLLQRSITAKDGEWSSLTEGVFKRKVLYQENVTHDDTWKFKVGKITSPITRFIKIVGRCFCRYWASLTQGSEAPPYFVQLSIEVEDWPVDGIQPERVESAINDVLIAAHDERCVDKAHRSCQFASRVRVQSIERSQDNVNVALVVFEVVYFSPPDRSTCPTEVWYISLTPAADVAKELVRAQSMQLFEEIGFPYPIISVVGGGKREIDLYAYIFGADLAVFFLVAIFYQSVIRNNSKFLDVYQLEDQFPKEFVFVLMVLFFLIVVDRVIYLWSFATGKLIFYILNLLLFTCSVTEYAWYLEPSHPAAGVLALRAIYLTKAVSLALQASQIKYGIAQRSTLYRQFLTSKVSHVNYLGFRLYRALPFLYELRCVLDWSCTTTSLTMYDWLKLEDINSSLFLVKCDADLNRAGHRQGQRQTKMTKFCSGICLFFILICVIWAPMLMYSSGNPTNIANPIIDVSARIDIKSDGGRVTLYQTSICKKLRWEDVDFHSDLDPHYYLEIYNVKDIQLICCQADASTSWALPKVVQTRFTRFLNQDTEIIFYWEFTRDRPKNKEVVKYGSDQFLNVSEVQDVKKTFNGTTNRFTLNSVYHRYFRVTGSGDVRFLEQTGDFVDVDVILNEGNPPWWSVYDTNALDIKECADLTGPMAIVVSEETPQGILGETLSKFSIWSLYLTFVLAVGRFIRLQCSDLRMRIPYENLPTCDRLIAICEDIYAARAKDELEVEEVLYWTLIKIYRSPHMLLEYTKPD